MIKKKTLFAFVLGAIMSISTLVGVSIFSNGNVFANPLDQNTNSYLIKFNSKTNLPMFDKNGNIDFTTENGNDVTFYVCNLDKSLNNWATFTSKKNADEKPSFVSNTDWLKGISSIKVTATKGSILDLNYNNQKVSEKWDGTMTHTFESDESYVFDLSSINPNYFEIRNSQVDNDATVKEIEVRLDCVNYHPVVRCYYDETMGKVTGLGEYHQGDVATIEAIANEGYRFNGFYTKDGALIQKDSKMEIKFDGTVDNYNFDARFKPIENEVGEPGYLGKYPQTRVTDEALLENLNKLIDKNPSKGASGAWVDDLFYANSSNNEDYHWHLDKKYNNETYRCVYFSDYRPSSIKDDHPLESADNNYQFKNGYRVNTRYWFKFETVEWTCTNIDNTYMTLKILDSHNFNSSDNSLYASSTLKSWINSTMFTSLFNEKDKTKVDVTHYSIGSSTNGSTEKGDFNSQVLLIDKADIDLLASQNVELKSKATDYALCLGLEADANGYAKYWLRNSTKEFNQKITEEMFVGFDGTYNQNAGAHVKTASIGVRAMISTKVVI